MMAQRLPMEESHKCLNVHHKSHDKRKVLQVVLLKLKVSLVSGRKGYSHLLEGRRGLKFYKNKNFLTFPNFPFKTLFFFHSI